MRKDSNSPRGGRPGGTGKDGGDKPFKKKNYDGRSSGGEGRPSAGPRKPYSGRLADSDKPKSRPDRPFAKDDEHTRPRRDVDPSRRNDAGDRKFNDRPKRSFDKPAFKRDDRDDRGGSEDRPKRSFDKPGFKRDDRSGSEDRPKRSFDKPAFKRNDRDDRGGSEDRPKRSFDKPAFKRDDRDDRGGSEDRPKRSFDKASFKKDDKGDKRKSTKGGSDKPKDSRPFRERLDKAFVTPRKPKEVEREVKEDEVIKELDEVTSTLKKRPFKKKQETTATGKKKHYKEKAGDDDNDDDLDEDYIDSEDKEIAQTNGPRLEMPLNKYIAHSGECSRRDAAELVKQGKVKVNGELVLDPGYRVQHDDKVTMSGKKLTPQRGFVYILLNKPKGFITTNDDPQGRRTVMDLVANSGAERLFPIGRLDRATTGLILITNDGDLTQKLSHPSYNIKKIYHVTLDKAITKADFDKVIAGVELEDGLVTVDALAHLEKKNELGLEIHSGKNRIVRRIFESLGYIVEKLDRVMYAGLTKKNLPRSKWRFLDEREIVLLKHFKN